MNEINNIFKNIPDEELKIGIRELGELYETGIIPSDGVFRKYEKALKDVIHDNNIHLVEKEFLKQAAFRWLNK